MNDFLRGSLHRRKMLKGLGALISLPWLESLAAKGVQAAAAGGAAPPLRMGFMFVPNGMNMELWTPTAEGDNFPLSPILEPLDSVKDKILLLSGMTHSKANANGDGPGDHARSASTFLTGAQAYKTSGANIRVGVSVDQLAAKKIGHTTRLASLEIGIEPNRMAGDCDSGYACAYSSSIAWKTPSTPLAKEINPRSLFERMFGDEMEITPAAREMRRKRRLSVLDYVSEDVKKLQPRLSGSDTRKLDEYFSSVREIETRISRFEQPGSEVKRPEKPDGIPEDYETHLKLMFDLLTLAYQTDITRISTFMLANEGSNLSYRSVGVTDGHHELSHHNRKPEKLEHIGRINKLHMKYFAEFLSKLNTIPEGDGVLLDNCMILYGSAIGDGDRHNHNDLPMLLAGRGSGSIKTGRHIRFPDQTPAANLFLSMLDRLGIHEEKFGDSTGRLDKLDA